MKNNPRENVIIKEPCIRRSSVVKECHHDDVPWKISDACSLSDNLLEFETSLYQIMEQCHIVHAIRENHIVLAIRKKLADPFYQITMAP